VELTDILGPRQIIPELAARNRWEAIDELIAILAATGKIKPAHVEAITNSVKRREYSMSTGVGCGIGCPTGSTYLIDDFAIALGRSVAGVEFDALDNQPVHIVVLNILPLRTYLKHYHIVPRLGKVLLHIPFREAIMKAPDADAIYKIICEGFRQVAAGLVPNTPLWDRAA
jgi:mannitol/fructose-specific phosphotransferase system IIA component (Ntr-type)